MANKMDKTVVIVSAVVGSLGVLSAILGFSAEGTKITLSDILVIDDACVYPQSPALALGVCAAIFLLMAQITFSAVGGCCGSCKSRAIPSETKRIVGVVCAVISWIAAVIAFALFVHGAAWNTNVVRVTGPVCYFLKDGIFAGAAVLTLAATALGVTSFIMLRRQPDATAAGAPKPGEQQPPAGIAMGHPQFPPPPQGYGQAPNYPQYSPPQGYGQAPNAQFPPPPPAQGYGSHAPKPGEQQPPAGIAMGHPQFPPPLQGYGQAPNYPQYSPPQGYGQAPNAQFPPPPPAQGYGSHAPNQQFPPPPQGHAQV